LISGVSSHPSSGKVFMSKRVMTTIKLQIPAGQASPAPPVGPALGQHGVNSPEFCKQFNARTKDQEGMIIPVVITVFADRSFTFIIKTPPVGALLKKALGIAKASPEPNREKVGIVTRKQVQEIAEIKMKDINAYDIEAAMRMVEGTARSMGILVKGIKPEEEAAFLQAKKDAEEGTDEVEEKPSVEKVTQGESEEPSADEEEKK